MRRSATALLKQLDKGGGSPPPPSIDPASIPPEPVPARPSRDPVAFLEEIEELRASGVYDWADRTLAGIYDNVKAHNWVTEGQANAIERIKDGTRRGSPECYDGGRNTNGRRSSGGVYRSVRS